MLRKHPAKAPFLRFTSKKMTNENEFVMSIDEFKRFLKEEQCENLSSDDTS
jgi:hypothetical protein